jgi:ABC-type multidrug transport system fused ATPase/permease subunit
VLTDAAVIRGSALYILDESTAALDEESDARIQQVVASLQTAIVLSIAHRLSTIVHFDRVLVMDSGRIVEDGAPKDLLSMAGSRFRAMAEATGQLENLMRKAES